MANFGCAAQSVVVNCSLARKGLDLNDCVVGLEGTIYEEGQRPDLEALGNSS